MQEISLHYIFLSLLFLTLWLKCMGLARTKTNSNNKICVEFIEIPGLVSVVRDVNN